nr:ribonuclease H-like domain-containing protein [Tanacetum cinerariifolium]
MESQSETTQTVSPLKLPVLKTGEYDLCSMRIEQYLTFTDHALWEVIVNGDSVSPVVSASAVAEGLIPPTTVEQKLARKNKLKAKSSLMLAILDEHLLKFHACKDAKSLSEAIKNRLGGNKESKKMQKTILKQNYDNFVASSQEGLDKTCDTFQKLISQLEIHGEVISQEDVYEFEIKSQSSSSLNSQNVAFVFLDNSSSTNETVNTAHSVSAVSSKDQAFTASYADDVMFSFFSNQSNASQLDNEDLEHIDTDDLEEMDLKWQVAMLTMRVKRFIKKTKKKLDLNGKETVGFDRTKVECYNCHRRGHFARECRAPRNQGNRNRDAPTKNEPMCTSTTNALVVQDGIGLESLEARIVVHEKNEVVYEEDIAFLKYDVQVKDISIIEIKNQLENALKEKDKTGLGCDGQKNESDLNDIHVNESEVLNNVVDSRESDENDNQVNDRLKKSKGYHAIPPPYTGNYMPPRDDLSFDGLDNSVFKSKVSETITSVPKIEINASKTSKGSLEKPKTVRSSAHLIEEWESNSEDENVFKPKEVKKTVIPSLEKIEFVNNRNTTVENENKAEKPRKFTVVLTKSGQVPVNAAKQSSHRAAASVSAVRRVNTAASRPNVNNALPTTYSYFKAHSRDQGIFDNGCSRHITGNKSYLTDYQEIDGGFVAFGRNAKGGKITGKGKIRTGKLDFEDVHFVKELKFNLFSISQIQVLLKVPRNNNMYSFDLKNVIPVGGLTCLFAKATLDESNLWHRRLGHINFKTMNKLVRGNLARDLPSKIFENDHIHVLLVRKESNTKPHTYYLVAIDDFSRFSWVFFLAINDETPEILKNFIEGIEKQMDHKVKTIRCDNKTEFKNRIMNEFYEMKGIRREFSVAMTPQQIGRTPALSFMRSFKCPVTILNTLDHLGKFDGKSDDGLFIGHSINSKAFRVFNTRTKIVEENLHINFLENKPNVAGTGPKWMFNINTLTMSMNYQPVFTENQTNGNAGTKANIDTGQAKKKTVPGPQYVLLPLFTSGSQGPKSSEDEVADDAGKKSAKVLRKENRVQDPAKEVNAVSSSFTTVDPRRERAQMNEFESMFGQDKDANGNRMFTHVSASGSTYVNLGKSIPVNVATLPNVDIHTNPLMPDLEDIADLQDTRIFSGAYDDKVEDAVADFNNLELITVRLVDLPKGKHTTGTKWVYRNKKDNKGIVVRNKARLVAQGYTQEEGIDYDEVFAPVARIKAIRLFFAYASFMRFIVYQIDVKSAFMYGTIEKEVYVCQPPGFEDPHFSNKVMQRDDRIFISQDKYADDILKKFDFSSVKTTSTLIETNKALLKDEEAEDVDVYLYIAMIRSVMYLTASRPDITFVVCVCARFQVTPKVSHLRTVKRIFRYFKGQPKLGLWYPKDSPFDLEAFSDSDYAGASIDRKFTTGGCQFLRKRLISWQCKKQTVVANSTTKAEYVDVANCCGQATECEGFEQIIDFLNASYVKYALTVNPTVYTSCIEQLWVTSKVKNVNGKAHIQALVDKKKVIITEASIRRDLRIEDEGGVDCLSNEVIFEQLALMGSTMASAVICLATNQNFNFSKYIFDNMVKHLDGRVKFLMYPRFFQAFLDNQVEGMDRHNASFVISSHTKKVFTNMKRERKDFSRKVLNLEEAKTAQAKKIVGLKKRVKKLEQKRKSKTSGLKRLRKIGSGRRGRMNEEDMFRGNDLDGDEVVVDVSASEKVEQSVKVVEKEVSTVDPITAAGEVVTTANIEVTTVATTSKFSKDELTLAQTLIEIKAAKPKAITTAVTTVTVAGTMPKEKWIFMQEPSEIPSPKPIISSQKPSQAKDKGKGKMVEPKRPLKRKDQIMMDAEIDKNLEAQMQAELKEEERLARLKEEETNIALVVEWDNTQAMMDADCELASRLQEEEIRELSIEEKSRLFVELMDKRKKHFVRLRAEKIISNLPTKAQKRNQMCTYLKNMANYKHNQLKNKIFEEIQVLFNNTMKWIEAFVPMDTEKTTKDSEKTEEDSSKRAAYKLEQEDAKRQRIEE